jgi:hypothetical protein
MKDFQSSFEEYLDFSIIKEQSKDASPTNDQGEAENPFLSRSFEILSQSPLLSKTARSTPIWLIHSPSLGQLTHSSPLSPWKEPIARTRTSSKTESPQYVSPCRIGSYPSYSGLSSSPTPILERHSPATLVPITNQRVTHPCYGRKALPVIYEAFANRESSPMKPDSDYCPSSPLHVENFPSPVTESKQYVEKVSKKKKLSKKEEKRLRNREAGMLC